MVVVLLLPWHTLTLWGHFIRSAKGSSAVGLPSVVDALLLLKTVIPVYFGHIKGQFKYFPIGMSQVIYVIYGGGGARPFSPFSKIDAYMLFYWKTADGRHLVEFSSAVFSTSHAHCHLKHCCRRCSEVFAVQFIGHMFCSLFAYLLYWLLSLAKLSLRQKPHGDSDVLKNVRWAQWILILLCNIQLHTKLVAFISNFRHIFILSSKWHQSIWQIPWTLCYLVLVLYKTNGPVACDKNKSAVLKCFL